jgi:hypothetical protein
MGRDATKVKEKHKSRAHACYTEAPNSESTIASCIGSGGALVLPRLRTAVSGSSPSTLPSMWSQTRGSHNAHLCSSDSGSDGGDAKLKLTCAHCSATGKQALFTLSHRQTSSVHPHLHTHAHARARAQTRIHSEARAGAHTCIHTHAHGCAHTRVHTHAHGCTHTRIHTKAHAQARAHTWMHKHVHTHGCTTAGWGDAP